MDTVNLTSSDGVLLSTTAVYTSCGTQAHPWVVRAQPGQKVKLTLYDFASRIVYKPSNENKPDRVTEVCEQYGMFLEPDWKLVSPFELEKVLKNKKKYLKIEMLFSFELKC